MISLDYMVNKTKVGDCAKNRVEDLAILIRKQLDMKDATPMNIFEIRNYIYYGFSNNDLRPTYWKVLLDYYSKNKFLSSQYYDKARNAYHKIKVTGEWTDLIDTDLNRSEFFLIDDKYAEYKRPIKQILLKFARTNSAIGYVQGMIQLVIPFYYVLSNSDSLQDRKYAEEDSFYLFHHLMNEINYFYSNSFDETPIGINGKIQNIYLIISTKDPELYEIMKKKGLLQTSFPLKWIIQLLTPIFSIENVLYIWDKIFSDAYRFEILEYLCATLIIFKKSEISEYDFGHCMECLQNIKYADSEKLFFVADQLRRTSKHFNDICNEFMQLRVNSSQNLK